MNTGIREKDGLGTNYQQPPILEQTKTCPVGR